MLQFIYLAYSMAIGVYQPLLPPYLRGLGLSGQQISAVLSVTPLLNVGVPLAWAWMADRTMRHARILQIICFGAAAGFAPMLVARSYPAIVASLVGYSVFVVGITGMVDSLTISHIRTRGGDYGRFRVWGSFGYLVSSVGTGFTLTLRGDRAADPFVPLIMLLCLVAVFLGSTRVRGSGEAAARPHLDDMKRLLKDRRFRALLVLSPLHWMCMSPYHIFFGILLRDRGLPSSVLSVSMALGVATEMAVLIWFARLRRLASIEVMMAIAFAASGLRWLGTALITSTVPMAALQLLHGLSFGLFWSAAITRVADCVPPALRATGQSLFMIATVGVGNIVGNMATGFMYDATGSAAPAYLAAAAFELVPLALVLRGILTGRASGRPAATTSP